ncbi:hypothetical protein K9M42_02135 [Patescibacteria group bacterium]|nr:hypothetical protein [Patescibacteria group bacterium]
MDDFIFEDFDFENFFVELTEKNIFNILGCQNLGFPLTLSGSEIFTLFKSTGLGTPSGLTRKEIATIVLYLNRKKDNEIKTAFFKNITTEKEGLKTIFLG